MVFLRSSKLLLLAVLAITLIAPVSAICDNVTITATEPQNLNYTYSINLPLEWVAINAVDCWVVLDSEKHFSNITLDCSENSSMTDVDYDGNYTAQFWAFNSSANDNCNATMPFIVDRTSEFEDEKPTMAGILIIALILIGFFIIVLSSYLKDHFKVLTLALSFLFIYMSMAVIIIIAREYIKVPILISNLENIFIAMIYGATLIAMIMLVFFIVNVMRKAQIWKKNKEEL